MDVKVTGFDWDEGNRAKCRKHGLTLQEIEQVLQAVESLIVRDTLHSLAEERHIAVGRVPGGRPAFVIFTLRRVAGEWKLRPISARYMHTKEAAKYEKEKEIAQIQK